MVVALCIVFSMFEQDNFFRNLLHYFAHPYFDYRLCQDSETCWCQAAYFLDVTKLRYHYHQEYITKNVKKISSLIFLLWHYLITYSLSTLNIFEGTLMQIWKSTNIFVFTWKYHVEDFTLKHLLRFEICSRKICEKFVYKHSETIQ